MMKFLLALLGIHVYPLWAQETSCRFSDTIEVLEDLVSVTQKTSLEQGTVQIEVAYAGLGWIGFGFSEKGEMLGSTVVIGQPGVEVIDFPNPGKFELTGYTHSAIKPLPASHQTLINPSIDYNGTHTTLRYKQPFEEAGQLSISATKENIAIFGIGSATGFQGVHVYNGAFPITLSKCSTVDGENTRAKLFNNETPKSDLWKIHGYIMAVAWGVMFPLGIGSSLLRRIIPGDHTWFTFHLMFNCLGVILTTGGFGLAIIAVIDEGNVHFNTTHKVIGLLVGIVTLLQSGLSLCSQAALVAKEELDKEQVFHYWGIIHRLIGTTLLIFGWWNCHSGIVAFSDRYGDYDKDLNTMVFWFVAGGLAFIILFMRAMAQLFRI